MSATYSIYPEHSLIFLKVIGVQSISSFGQYVFKIMADKRCEPDMNTLLDCSEAAVSPRSDEEERSYREFVSKLTEDPNAPRRKVAVVCGDNLINFGVSRMREVPLSDSPIELSVFRETSEALAWLSLDVSIGSTLTANEPVPA